MEYVIDFEDNSDFAAFRKAYPGTKGGLKTEFDHFKKKHKDWKAALPLLMPALDTEKQWRTQATESGVWVPQWAHLKTWISQRRWEQEFNFNFLEYGNNGNKKNGGGLDAFKANIINRLHHFQSGGDVPQD